MRKLLFGGLAAASLFALGACQSVTPATVCATVAAAEANPTVQSQMATVGANSAVGVLWADLQSGCVAGQPAAGVDETWTQAVMTGLEDALPAVLPALIGLI